MRNKVIQQIKEIALRYNIQKIVLFGSRARGDHTPVSDYDIAVFAEALSAFDKARFFDDIEEIDTLKKIDIVFVDDNTGDDLVKNIMRDGVNIFE